MIPCKNIWQCKGDLYGVWQFQGCPLEHIEHIDSRKLILCYDS